MDRGCKKEYMEGGLQQDVPVSYTERGRHHETSTNYRALKPDMVRVLVACQVGRRFVCVTILLLHCAARAECMWTWGNGRRLPLEIEK